MEVRSTDPNILIIIKKKDFRENFTSYLVTLVFETGSLYSTRIPYYDSSCPTVLHEVFEVPEVWFNNITKVSRLL